MNAVDTRSVTVDPEDHVPVAAGVIEIPEASCFSIPKGASE